jgi:hypothetical protein
VLERGRHTWMHPSTEAGAGSGIGAGLRLAERIEGAARATRALSLRRVLATLLLPASLLPVLILSPSLARAPATLWQHAERLLAPAHARVHHAPPPMQRYPIGASRLEVDVFEPTTGPFTPQVGVSPLAEHARWVHSPYEPVVLIVPFQEASAR